MNGCNTDMLLFLFFCFISVLGVNHWPRWGNQLFPAPVWPSNRRIKETHSHSLCFLQLVGLICTVNDAASSTFTRPLCILISCSVEVVSVSSGGLWRVLFASLWFIYCGFIVLYKMLSPCVYHWKLLEVHWWETVSKARGIEQNFIEFPTDYILDFRLCLFYFSRRVQVALNASLKPHFSSGKMRLSHISGIKSPIFHLLCFSGNKKTHPSGEHSLTMTPDCSFRRPASDTCEPMSHSARVSWPFC